MDPLYIVAIAGLALLLISAWSKTPDSVTPRNTHREQEGEDALKQPKISGTCSKYVIYYFELRLLTCTDKASAGAIMGELGVLSRLSKKDISDEVERLNRIYLSLPNRQQRQQKQQPKKQS